MTIQTQKPYFKRLRSLQHIGLSILVFSVALSSCSKHPKAKVNIHIEQASFPRIIVDHIEADKISKSDTFLLKQNRAEWKVTFDKDEPCFLRLRNDTDILATLLVAPGERVSVSGKMPNFSSNYKVHGSEGSELCRKLNVELTKSSRKLDSLYNGLDQLPPDKMTQQKYELGKVFIKQKQKSTTFIIRNIRSLATAMALYQKISNQIPLFGSQQDLFLFEAVRDTLTKLYPGSSYVKVLNEDIKNIEQSYRVSNMMSQAQVIGAPDFTINDRFGQKIRLSALKGKVVILNFWVSSSTDCRLFQKELRDLYNQDHSRGLEIIQIGMDTDQALWIQTIQDLDLPGIHVNDFKGAQSKIAMLYNVPRLPYCYIINKQGDLTHKHLTGGALRNAVSALL